MPGTRGLHVFRGGGPEDPRHAHPLAFHVARRGLRREHEAAAHLQAESARELHADVRVQPVIGLEIPAFVTLLVEIGERALPVWIYALDANRKRGRGRAGQPGHRGTRCVRDDPLAGARLDRIARAPGGLGTAPRPPKLTRYGLEIASPRALSTLTTFFRLEAPAQYRIIS